jgi:hypothetical protein
MWDTKYPLMSFVSCILGLYFVTSMVLHRTLLCKFFLMHALQFFFFYVLQLLCSHLNFELNTSQERAWEPTASINLDIENQQSYFKLIKTLWQSHARLSFVDHLLRWTYPMRRRSMSWMLSFNIIFWTLSTSHCGCRMWDHITNFADVNSVSCKN